MGHSRGTVEAKAVGACSLGTVEAQLGHNLRIDEKKVSLGSVEAHSGHTFLLGTVGAGSRLI